MAIHAFHLFESATKNEQNENNNFFEFRVIVLFEIAFYILSANRKDSIFTITFELFDLFLYCFCRFF